jgi:hypothetical protein
MFAFLAAACTVVLVHPAGAAAQARFEVLAHDMLPQVPGLHIYTIRDTQRAACYTFFEIERPPAPVAALPPVAMNPNAPPPAPPIPDEPAQPVPLPWATLPWATATPGQPTGGWELLAESMRRALVDPSTVHALSEPLDGKLSDLADRMSRMEALLENLRSMTDARVFPVACEPAKK